MDLKRLGKKLAKAALIVGALAVAYNKGYKQNPTFHELTPPVQNVIQQESNAFVSLVNSAVSDLKNLKLDVANQKFKEAQKMVVMLEKIDPRYKTQIEPLLGNNLSLLRWVRDALEDLGSHRVWVDQVLKHPPDTILQRFSTQGELIHLRSITARIMPQQLPSDIERDIARQLFQEHYAIAQDFRENVAQLDHDYPNKYYGNVVGLIDNQVLTTIKKQMAFLK